MGQSIVKCAKILKTQALKDCNELKIHQAGRFIELYEMEWGNKISISAIRTLHDNQQNAIRVIPLGQDVKLLADHLRHLVKTSFDRLMKDMSDRDAYGSLQEPLLSQIILFNRRRSGEVSRITLKDYYGLHKMTESAEEMEMSEL